MRSFRSLRKALLRPDDDIFLIFKEVLSWKLPNPSSCPAAAAAACCCCAAVCHALPTRQVLDSRTRLEGRMRDIDEKLEEMDAKFEHNIAAMNELLQKNLKYLKHVAN